MQKMTISPSEGCVYCGGLWNETTKQMDHMRMCYIVTGHLTVLGARQAKERRERRTKAPRELPEWLNDD